VTESESGALGTSLLFDVFALNQAVGRMLGEAMRDGPLTPGEYAIYSAVFELESATPTELAGRLGMRLTTFIDQLRLLESRGHAGRIPHPTDGRSYKVLLTAAGREAHRAANHRFEEAALAFRASLSGGEPAAQACLRSIRVAAERAMLEVASPRPRAGRGD
jgi:DNA-binding MarR family transcriptional regulator